MKADGGKTILYNSNIGTIKNEKHITLIRNYQLPGHGDWEIEELVQLIQRPGNKNESGSICILCMFQLLNSLQNLSEWGKFKI